MREMIYEFPKAELHLHLEGTFEPELLFRIARRNKVRLGYRSLAEVKRAYNFSDLGSFLAIYYGAMTALLVHDDFYELTDAYLRRAAEQGVRHAEVFFDPQAHTSRGVKFEAVVTGIHHALRDGQRRYGVSSKLIMCFLRDKSRASAESTLEDALPFKDMVHAVGLDSKEIGNPPSKFESVFKKARREGFLAVAHAGEEAPPSYIWEALDLLGVSRVDHGYHCFEDASLVRRLAQERIPITACPLASLGVHYFDSIGEFPLKRMMKSGLLVMVNSDDPAYFGGYVAENYAAVCDGLGLNEGDVLTLLKNSIGASFLDRKSKDRYSREIDRRYEALRDDDESASKRVSLKRSVKA